MKTAGRFCRLVSALALGAISWGVAAAPDAACAATGRKRSPDGVWTLRPGTAGVPRVRSYDLDARALARVLGRAPSESAATGALRPVLSLPLPGGGYARFRIEKSPIFSPALQSLDAKCSKVVAGASRKILSPCWVGSRGNERRTCKGLCQRQHVLPYLQKALR